MDSPIQSNNNSIILNILKGTIETSTTNPTSAPDYNLSKYINIFEMYVAIPMAVLVVSLGFFMICVSCCYCYELLSKDTYENLSVYFTCALFLLFIVSVFCAIIMLMMKFVFMRNFFLVIIFLLICVGSVRFFNYWCEKCNPN